MEIRCFHINYPFCGIGFIVATFFVRMNATTQLTIAQKLKQTDWFGAFLFIGSFTSFLVGLSFGGVQQPWTSGFTLAPMIVGLVGIAVFLAGQVYTKPHSLLPMSIFYNWSAISAFYCAMINGLVVSTFGLLCRIFTNMSPALHCSLLHSLLLYVSPWSITNPRRYRPVSCRLFPCTWFYRCRSLDRKTGTLSMGHLARLGRHNNFLWSLHHL